VCLSKHVFLVLLFVAIAEIFHIVFHRALAFRTGVLEKDILLLVRKDMDGDEATFFPWINGNVAEVTASYFHRLRPLPVHSFSG